MWSACKGHCWPFSAPHVVTKRHRRPPPCIPAQWVWRQSFHFQHCRPARQMLLTPHCEQNEIALLFRCPLGNRLALGAGCSRCLEQRCSGWQRGGFFGGDRQNGTFKEGHCSIALHSGITKGTGLYWHPWTLFMVLTLTFSLWRILQNSLKSQLRRTQCISFSTRLHFIEQKDFMFILEGYKFWGNSRQFCGHHFCPVTQSFPCCSVKVQIQLLPHTNEVWTLWLGTLFCMTPACMGSSFWRVDSHSTMGAQEQRGH